MPEQRQKGQGRWSTHMNREGFAFLCQGHDSNSFSRRKMAAKPTSKLKGVFQTIAAYSVVLADGDFLCTDGYAL